MKDFDRPSMHGKYLGEALVLIARAGRKALAARVIRDDENVGADATEPCLTCAFRSGTVANMSGGTGLLALNCALKIDENEFACHHGLKDGEPTRICAGYALAVVAPFAETKEIVKAMYDQLRLLGDSERDGYVDAVRADFDAWYAGVDPDGEMDAY